MNILEMHIAVRLELDKTQDFELPIFQPEQIDYWLNKSFEIYIEETAYPKMQGKPSFEETQQVIDELREVVKPGTPIVPTLSDTDNRESFVSKLPSDYKHLVRHTCKTSNHITNEKGELDIKEQTVSGIITTQDKLNIQLKDPFWTIVPSEPLYFITGDSIVYPTLGKFNIEETYLTYIMKTPKMKLGSQYSTISTDVDCAITIDYVQHKIINNAVNMILENIESQRYQTNLNELNKTN